MWFRALGLRSGKGKTDERSGWQGAHDFFKPNLGVYLLLHVTGIPNMAQGCPRSIMYLNQGRNPLRPQVGEN